MKPIRFYIAMILARLSYFVLKLIGRNGTHFPGVLATKICPDILKYLEAGDTFIAVTGTNGKTTTVNMILSFLEAKGVDVMANQAGSNVAGGIISALLGSTTFFGKNKRAVTLFEVDERASIHIFPYIKPDILVVTNLFRDSYTRNAHVDYIYSILEKSIPDSTTLILNGDDLITSNIKPNNERKFFSIFPQEGEREVKDSIINDLVYCPKCGSKIEFSFQRYHHIGVASCPNCDFKSPKPTYQITSISKEQFTLKEGNQNYNYVKRYDNITDLYNQLSAISALREMGYSHEEISESFVNIDIVKSRYEEIIIGDKRIINILVKGQNPIATSRVFDFIANQEEWGTISILLVQEETPYLEEPSILENVAWIYDANFEYLNKSNIRKIYCMGNRSYEYISRMLLSNIPAEKLVRIYPNNVDIEFETDTFIIAHDVNNVLQSNDLKEQLIKEANDES